MSRKHISKQSITKPAGKKRRNADGDYVSDTWATPQEFVTALETIFGRTMHLDICANARNTKCDYYVDRATDALGSATWRDLYLNGGGHHLKGPDDVLNVFCNAGYSNVLPWCERADIERTASNANIYILAHDNFCGPWFRYSHRHAEHIMLLYPRVQFIPPPGEKDSTNSRCSTLLLYTPHTPRVRYAVAPISYINWLVGVSP